ncbi:MAG: DUF2203 domain-containing protein [Candidatus Obscuribacterales bacterium]|nr:DUF2203 domain-containing protein [Candidatus Obscuribacterales bacterium]
MSTSATFSLSQAQALLPRLKEQLSQANDELDSISIKIAAASQECEEAEEALMAVKTNAGDVVELTALRDARQRYESSIDALTSAKREYLECFERWMIEITECGVILRDIRSGLLDFPARKGAVDYFLCWRLGERDIDYWHLENDGFQGRRPLAVLDEYF